MLLPFGACSQDKRYKNSKIIECSFSSIQINYLNAYKFSNIDGLQTENYPAHNLFLFELHV